CCARSIHGGRHCERERAMRIERGFLLDVLDNPDDDAPRLVYADWLDEHGLASRAEFIRLQVELARLDRYDPRWPALRRREAELLAAHAAQWVEEAGLADLKEPAFRRGFVEHAAFRDCLHFLAESRRRFQRTPLSSVELGGVGDWNEERGYRKGLDRLLRAVAGRRLRRINLRTDHSLGWGDLAALEHLPPDARLEELDLSDN